MYYGKSVLQWVNLTNYACQSNKLTLFLCSAVHTERTKLYRRTIVPLQDWERDNHLFWIPDDVTKFGPYEGIVPENKSTLPPVENPNVAFPSVIAQSLPPTNHKLYNAKEAMVS